MKLAQYVQLMTEDFLLNKYAIVWTDITDKLFSAEIRHVDKNEFGGSLTTPVGILIGFVQGNPMRNPNSMLKKCDKAKFILGLQNFKENFTFFGAKSFVWS
jgi:hypothetical protein